MKTLLLFGFSSSMCFAQAKSGPVTAGPEIIAEASAKLIAALTAAIAKDGPAKAIGVCHERAPEIAAEVGKAQRVTLRRATPRPRNPKNAADDAELEILAAFNAAIGMQQALKPRHVNNTDGSMTFTAPIVISNPLCLQCHGTVENDIAPETLTAIRKLYPNDKATGYKSGDLRGIWSVTFPAAP